jgi:hypothetical protein
MEVVMVKIRPYILDIVVGVLFLLLPGIRGYENWQIYEYGLLLLIFGYIVYLHHKKRTEVACQKKLSKSHLSIGLFPDNRLAGGYE